MLRIDRHARTLARLAPTPMAEAALLERADLQRMIRNSADDFFAELGEEMLAVAEEARPSVVVDDRIDLLALDRDGAAVVVELKRDAHKPIGEGEGDVARNMQVFRIAQPGPDGSVQLHPMKAWLRQHPEHIPGGGHPDTTNSRTLARALIRAEWSFRETPAEFVLFPRGMEAIRDEELEREEADDAEEAVDPTFFRLEAQLRDFLAHNLHAVRLNGKSLRLYVDGNQRQGVEYPSATGPIDILALDQGGGFVVFELKRAASPDSAIGQLARYMGWVKATLAGGAPVHGVVVAREITDRLRYAAQVIPNVSLFEYQVQFELKQAL